MYVRTSYINKDQYSNSEDNYFDIVEKYTFFICFYRIN